MVGLAGWENSYPDHRLIGIIIRGAVLAALADIGGEPKYVRLPLGLWVNSGVEWLLNHYVKIIGIDPGSGINPKSNTPGTYSYEVSPGCFRVKCISIIL